MPHITIKDSTRTRLKRRQKTPIAKTGSQTKQAKKTKKTKSNIFAKYLAIRDANLKYCPLILKLRLLNARAS